MRLRSFAIVTTAVNVLVILWGAFVRASGSGAGCGRHWPLCNGQVVPQSPAAATVIEAVHRLTSGIALILVVALMVMVFRRTGPGHRLRRAAVACTVLIVVEALVGAGLVLLELVGDDSSMMRAGYLAVHLANTFALLAALTVTTLWADRPDPAGPVASPWRSVGAVLLLLLVVGITGAVTALGDTLFPSGTLAEGIAQDQSPTAHLLIRLRVIHPAVAVGAAVAAAALVVRILGRRHGAPVLTWARAFLVLVFLQLAVGVVNLVLLVPIATQLLHLLVADLVWMAGVALFVELREHPEPA